MDGSGLYTDYILCEHVFITLHPSFCFCAERDKDEETKEKKKEI